MAGGGISPVKAGGAPASFGLAGATSTFLAVNLVLLAFFVVIVARSTFTPESATEATLSVTSAFGVVPVRLSDRPARAADPDFAAEGLAAFARLGAAIAEQRESAADLSVPAEAIFLRGSDALTPQGAAALAALVPVLQRSPRGVRRVARIGIPAAGDPALAERRAAALLAQTARTNGASDTFAAGVTPGGGAIRIMLAAEDAR